MQNQSILQKHDLLDFRYSLLYSNIYVFFSLHQTKKYDSIKKNPRKRKLTTMIHLGMRPKKIRKGTLTFHRTVVLPLLATISGSTDREWDRKEWEIAVECILTYASSSHYIKHRNMILSNKIKENKNGQQWCIQVWDQNFLQKKKVWDQKRKEKALTFHKTVVLPLLATTLGAADHEKERRMRNRWCVQI